MGTAPVFPVRRAEVVEAVFAEAFLVAAGVWPPPACDYGGKSRPVVGCIGYTMDSPA